ncbi:B2 bradykinin receptor-like [Betta splendens]|uniref:B1 bradykinin receptor n=1 Tax=Betta splendens TaxID=158456 RepID=A0A9W2XJC0_BETSP|nr:B2 bradykinin receptor-like [Betta splendens]
MTSPSTSFAANFSSVAAHGHQNQANATGCPIGKTEDWVYTALEANILVISALGIGLNLFVLSVFCCHRKRCTVAELYLSNLAAADLLLMSFLPFWAVSAGNRFAWAFGGALCRVVNLSIVMNVYCSIYFLVLVSMDRYWALVKPLSSEKMRSAKFAKLGCVLVWGGGLLLSVPTIIYRETTTYPHLNQTYCSFSSEVQLGFEVMLSAFSFIIPLPIISFCTWKILQALNKRLRRASKPQQKEHKATRLILAVLLAFLLCWVPFHLVRIIELLYRLKVLKECTLRAALGVCRQVFMNLAYFNSVLNPILYVIMGGNFRKKARELFLSPARTMSIRTGNSSLNSKGTFRLRSARLKNILS